MKALTFQQLRGACAVVDAGFNVSRSAGQLHTTQSAISKTIKALEDELGISIFVRSSVRITGLTDYGHEFIEIARGILRDADMAIARAQDDNRRTRGLLRIGATHIHATYALPKVIQSFRSRYPDISVQVEQADAAEVAQWVSSRRVQMGIAGAAVAARPGLITLAAMRLERCIVVPPGHELLAVKMPTIADIARYPIVAHDELHPAGVRLRALFQGYGITPMIAVTAPDATVLKEYVAVGMGIAILHKIAIRTEDETKLATIDASHLVPSTDTHVIFRQGEYLRSYVYDFTEAFAPQWPKRSIMSEIERQTAAVELIGSAPAPARAYLPTGADGRLVAGRLRAEHVVDREMPKHDHSH